MFKKSRYTKLQKVERNFRVSFTNFINLFFPNNHKIFTWLDIVLIVSFLSFIVIIIKVSAN